jgi:hypothetical protein
MWESSTASCETVSHVLLRDSQCRASATALKVLSRRWRGRPRQWSTARRGFARVLRLCWTSPWLRCRRGRCCDMVLNGARGRSVESRRGRGSNGGPTLRSVERVCIWESRQGNLCCNDSMTFSSGGRKRLCMAKMGESRIPEFALGQSVGGTSIATRPVAAAPPQCVHALARREVM